MELASAGSRQGLIPGPRKSVPYGQACTNCSKAKCKCISRGTPGAACERCQRLGKECVPSVSVRKRAVRRPASERAAHLEEKLDDLVSILRAQAAGNPPVVSTYRTTSNGELPGASTGVDANAGATLELDPSIGVVPGASKLAANGHTLPLPSPIDTSPFCDRYPSATSYPTPPSVTSSNDVSLSPVEAEETLRLFRDKFLAFFPFVYIPPETTAAQLQQTRPFLWLNIIAICSKSQTRKSIFSQKVREYVSQKMLLDLERNVDLLLGLIAYLGWGMHHFTGKPFIVAFINLALTIVTDLRLDKPAQDNYYRELHCFKPTYSKPPLTSAVRTNEERRATLACFILCSGISNFLRTQSMRWTAHMEDSLQKLTTDPECPNDAILVAMVKTYRVQEDAAQITWRSTEPAVNQTSLRGPPFIYFKALRASLEAVKKDLPASLADNRIVLSHLYAAELSIADMALWNIGPWLCNHTNKTPTTSGNGWVGVDVGKLDAYYSILQASKASLDNWLQFSITDYAALSFSLTLHFFKSAQTIYRLTLVDDPDWDRNIVKNSIDVIAVLEQAASNFARVPAVCGLESSDDPENMDYYTRASGALRSTIPAWAAALEQAGLGASSGPQPADGVAPAPGAPSATTYQMQGPLAPELASMEWLDDPWLSDMLRSWEGGI